MAPVRRFLQAAAGGLGARMVGDIESADMLFGMAMAMESQFFDVEEVDVAFAFMIQTFNYGGQITPCLPNSNRSSAGQHVQGAHLRQYFQNSCQYSVFQKSDLWRRIGGNADR